MRISSSHFFLGVCLWCRPFGLAADSNGKAVEAAGFGRSLL